MAIQLPETHLFLDQPIGLLMQIPSISRPRVPTSTYPEAFMLHHVDPVHEDTIYRAFVYMNYFLNPAMNDKTVVALILNIITHHLVSSRFGFRGYVDGSNITQRKYNGSSTKVW